MEIHVDLDSCIWWQTVEIWEQNISPSNIWISRCYFCFKHIQRERKVFLIQQTRKPTPHISLSPSTVCRLVSELLVCELSARFWLLSHPGFDWARPFLCLTKPLKCHHLLMGRIEDFPVWVPVPLFREWVRAWLSFQLRNPARDVPNLW